MSKKKLKYPLEQVLEIKIRRVKDAEEVVKQKQEILDREQEKLRKYESELKKVQDHHDAKLQQIRDALDQGKAPYKIDQMKNYLKEVKIQLQDEKRKVDRQKKEVKNAEDALEKAKKILKEKRLEVDKLEMHKKDWIEKEYKEILRQEAKDLDEIGSLVYLSNKRKEREEDKRRKRGKDGK